MNTKYSFELLYKDFRDDHPPTAIDFCHLFGQRTEALSTYAPRTSHTAGAKEPLHVSALEVGRQQSAAFLYVYMYIYVMMMKSPVRPSRRRTSAPG